MRFSKILVPVDFSEFDSRAVALATSLAKDSGARLLIVHVEEPPTAYGEGGMYYGLPDPSLETLRKMLHEIQPPDAEVQHEHRFLQGHPADAIVRAAAAEQADLIVMSTHGRTGLFRFLMGSVAESVVRRAPCPVLTYKPPSAAATQGSQL
jgi:nucleotide-binding universal stress UspA family protein